MKKISLLSLLALFSIGQLSAKVYRVNSMSSYNSAISKVAKGDTISWHPGTYSDINAQEYTEGGAVVKPHATIANTGAKYLQPKDATGKLTITEPLNAGIYLVRVKHLDSSVDTQRLIIE